MDSRGLQRFAPLTGVVFGNGRFVAIGAQRSMISMDGITWTDGGPSVGSKVAFGDGMFVAVGYSIWTSPDGVAWTQRRAVMGPGAFPGDPGEGAYRSDEHEVQHGCPYG